MKVLNLYAGIGGNRKLWEDVEVTAVEIDPEIAEIYQDFFPDDTVIITDAHQYLLDHFKEYDFIWASPPCPSHSVTNHFLKGKGVTRYPDMKLYQEIIFLSTFYHGLFCVENVVSYYEPLIKPAHIDRHYFWANYHIKSKIIKNETALENQSIKTLQKQHGFNLDKYQMGSYKKRQILRNCVYPPLGKHVFKCARDTQPLTLIDYVEVKQP